MIQASGFGCVGSVPSCRIDVFFLPLFTARVSSFYAGFFVSPSAYPTEYICASTHAPRAHPELIVSPLNLPLQKSVLEGAHSSFDLRP